MKADVSIAKNYLSENELSEMNEIVEMYLDYATRQARRHIPMTMADWAEKLDAFLKFNDAEILMDKARSPLKLPRHLQKANSRNTGYYRIFLTKVISTGSLQNVQMSNGINFGGCCSRGNICEKIKINQVDRGKKREIPGFASPS